MFINGFWRNGRTRRTGITCGDTIELMGHYTYKKYPEQLKRTELLDKENEQVIVLLTNNLES